MLGKEGKNLLSKVSPFTSFSAWILWMLRKSLAGLKRFGTQCLHLKIVYLWEKRGRNRGVSENFIQAMSL